MFARSALQRAALAQVDRANIGVAVAHHAANLLVAPAFPFADRVLAVPGFVGAAVECGQAQLVAFGHIQVDTRRCTACLRRRHGGLGLEVDHHRAASVLRWFVAEHAKGVVGAVSIYFANARHQVVQVGFGGLEACIVARAILAPA